MFHGVTTKYVCGIDLHAKTLRGVVVELSGLVVARGTVPFGNPHLKWAFSEIGSGMVRVSPPPRRNPKTTGCDDVAQPSDSF